MSWRARIPENVFQGASNVSEPEPVDIGNQSGALPPRATPEARFCHALRNVSDHSLRFISREAAQRLGPDVAQRPRLQERSSHRLVGSLQDHHHVVMANGVVEPLDGYAQLLP